VRIDLGDARESAGGKVALIIEDDDTAVGQQVRVMLPVPLAAQEPDHLSAVDVD
jgi:hypothetical protein